MIRNLFIAIALSIAGAGGFSFWQLRRVVVLVENASEAPLEEVEVEVKGARVSVGQVLGGRRGKVEVVPTGDSALVLRYAVKGRRFIWTGDGVQQLSGHRSLLLVEGPGVVKEISWSWPRSPGQMIAERNYAGYE